MRGVKTDIFAAAGAGARRWACGGVCAFAGLSVFLSVCLCSCQKEHPEKKETPTWQAIFTANRIYYQSLLTAWAEGDAVAIFDNGATAGFPATDGARFDLTDGAGTMSATLGGTLQCNDAQPARTFYALYPYGAATVEAATGVAGAGGAALRAAFTLDGVQSSDRTGDYTFMMSEPLDYPFAIAQGSPVPTLYFRQLTSQLRFSVTGIPSGEYITGVSISSTVPFTAVQSYNLCARSGDADFLTGTPVPGENRYTMSVTCAPVAGECSVPLVLFPQTLKNATLYITINTSDSRGAPLKKYGAVKQSQTIVFNRSESLTLPLDLSVLPSALPGGDTPFLYPYPPAAEQDPEPPAVVDNGLQVYYWENASITAQALGENFFCLENGFSYSPLGFYRLDAPANNSLNPNGWASSGNKLPAGATPGLTIQQYLAAKPYIIYDATSNAFSGPATSSSLIQTYTYNNIFFTGTIGTPCVRFRTMNSTNANDIPVVTAVKERKVVRTTSGSNTYTVYLTDGSSTTRNGTQTNGATNNYNNDGVWDNGKWNIGDVILVQYFDNWGWISATASIPLKTGFIEVTGIQSDNYDPATGIYTTQDTRSRITFNCYWPK